jgi:hypothetical protein
MSIAIRVAVFLALTGLSAVFLALPCVQIQ